MKCLNIGFLTQGNQWNHNLRAKGIIFISMASKMASVQQYCNIFANKEDKITNKLSIYRFSDMRKPMDSCI